MARLTTPIAQMAEPAPLIPGPTSHSAQLEQPHGPASAGDTPRVLIGIGFLLAGLAVFSLQDVVVKKLSGHYPLWQIVFIRSLVTVLIIAPLVAVKRGRQGFQTTRWSAHTLRGLLAFISYTLYYIAVVSLPLAEVAALYASAPLFLTLISMPVLGEKVGIRRGVAVMVGFMGVIIMLRPGTEVFQLAGLPAVGAAFLYGCGACLTRSMGTTERPMLLTLTSSLIYLLGAATVSLVLLAFDFSASGSAPIDFLLRPWHRPAMTDLGLMSLTGVIAAIGFICLAEAYRLTPVSVAAPFEYSYLLYATAFGFWFFAELPSTITVIGGSIVVVSGLFVIARELQLSRTTRWMRRARVPVGGPPGAAR